MKQAGSVTEMAFLSSVFLSARLSILMLVLLLATAVHGQEIETVRLNYTDAEAVLPQLRQLFNPDELTVSGMNQQLILRGRNTRVIQQALEAIASLDQRRRQFRITLETGGAGVSSGTGVGAGATVTSSTSNVAIGFQGRQISTRSNQVQTVTVLEHTPVLIQQGVMRPVVTEVYTGAQGSGVRQDYQSLDSGMRVIPRAVGENEVELEIEVAEARPLGADGMQVQRGNLSTRRRVRAGEWVELAERYSDSDTREAGVIHYSTERLDSGQAYRLRVDMMD
ncbi:MAG: hypothetical protein IPM37_03490 [Hahellaceae bacterium]|nr:hypothetical protein [Hahellaceae bacterium]